MGAAYVPIDGRSLVILGVVTALACLVGSFGYGMCLLASKPAPPAPDVRTPLGKKLEQVAVDALARSEADRALERHGDEMLAMVNGDPDFEHAVLVDLAHLDELASGGER